MSNITYPAKTVAGGGGSTYVEGNSLPAAELQADFDAVANVVNGNLDEDNLSGGTQIPNSKLAQIADTKVDDYSADATEAAATSTPGDSATLGSNLATDLSEEIEHLRYRIHANAGYKTGTVYRNSSGTNVDAEWVEPPIRGRNLLYNSGFEVFSGSSGDPPDGWTDTSSIASTAIAAAATPATGADKRTLTLGANSAGDGITQTVTGLKASTKYLFGCKYIRTSGTWTFSTAGGLASGNYQNLTVTDNSTTTLQVASMVVQSTTSAGDITVSIVETGGAASTIDLVEVWLFELGDDYPAADFNIPTQTASASTQVTNIPATVASGTDWNTQWTDVSTLALSQYVPGPGYRLVYEASIAWASVLNSQQFFFGFRLEQDNGSTSIVDGPYIEVDDDVSLGETNGASTMRLTHIVDNATPGLTYTFTPQVTAADSASGVGSAPRLHPLVAVTAQGAASAGSNTAIQTTSRARLRVERM